MKTFTLAYDKDQTYPEFTLIVKGNNFGDQIIYIQQELKDGTKKYIWTEVNHEGQHRNVDFEFTEYMRTQCLEGLLK